MHSSNLCLQSAWSLGLHNLTDHSGLSQITGRHQQRKWRSTIRYIEAHSGDRMLSAIVFLWFIRQASNPPLRIQMDNYEQVMAESQHGGSDADRFSQPLAPVILHICFPPSAAIFLCLCLLPRPLL